MTVALFANSKAALAFAGIVTVGAALVVSMLGDHFIPGNAGEVASTEAGAQTIENPGTGDYTISDGGPVDAEGNVAITADGAGDADVVVEFASDEDLIADTRGFNPSPSRDAKAAQEDKSKADEPSTTVETGEATN